MLAQREKNLKSVFDSKNITCRFYVIPKNRNAPAKKVATMSFK